MSKDFDVIEPLNLYFDPRATHMTKRWWHRFIFWKPVIYPTLVVNRKFISKQELLKNAKKQEQ